MVSEPGLFDVVDRLRQLSDLGDQFEAFRRAVNFEIFRADLNNALGYRSGPQGGRRLIDPVMMFKLLLIQVPNTLYDERSEFLINDRLSFMRFLSLGLSDRLPDAIKGLFECFEAVLWAADYTPSGQIIDASLVAVLRQRNTDEGEPLWLGQRLEPLRGWSDDEQEDGSELLAWARGGQGS